MPSKPVIRKEDWERRLHEVQVTKNELNRLIMDYLVIEGYKSVAEEFSLEANITPPVDFESIESRMDIREALQRGDVEEAITRVNDLNPEVGHYSRTPHERIRILMHHSQTRVESVMILQNHYFSLQYDLSLAYTLQSRIRTNAFIYRSWTQIRPCIFIYNNKS